MSQVNRLRIEGSPSVILRLRSANPMFSSGRDRNQHPRQAEHAARMRAKLFTPAGIAFVVSSARLERGTPASRASPL
jgi:hypothetical protein